MMGIPRSPSSRRSRALREPVAGLDADSSELVNVGSPLVQLARRRSRTARGPLATRLPRSHGRFPRWATPPRPGGHRPQRCQPSEFSHEAPQLLKMILATLAMLLGGLKQSIQIILMFGLSSLDQGIGQAGIKRMIWMTGSGMTSLAARLCRYIRIQGTGR